MICLHGQAHRSGKFLLRAVLDHPAPSKARAFWMDFTFGCMSSALKSSGKLYWYGATGDILDESDASGNITDEFVFFGGKRIARRNISSGNIYYYLADHLGTARMIVQAGQTSACYDADFDPFGGEHIVANSCPQNYKFTGK